MPAQTPTGPPRHDDELDPDSPHPRKDNGWEKEDDHELRSGGGAVRRLSPIDAPHDTTRTALVKSEGDPGGTSVGTSGGGGDGERRLTAAQFRGLAEVPPELEWFANLDNPRTRRAYRIDLDDFMAWSGIRRPEEFRSVTRAHVIAWRKDLEQRGDESEGLAPSTIRRKLSALASLFDYLCERNAVPDNPVHGVKRPPVENGSHGEGGGEGGGEGKTPAISDAQARKLLDAPPEDTLKGLRDRAILAVLLYHGLRRDELVKLRPMDVHPRRGVPHLRVRGKGGKTRYLPLHTTASDRIHVYLEHAGHADDTKGPLFRPVRNRTSAAGNAGGLTAEGVYRCVIKHYAAATGLGVEGFCTHSLRATAATAALDGGADLSRVQGWLGHANVSTTRLYDRRRSKPEDSPTWRIRY